MMGAVAPEDKYYVDPGHGKHVDEGEMTLFEAKVRFPSCRVKLVTDNTGQRFFEMKPKLELGGLILTILLFPVWFPLFLVHAVFTLCLLVPLGCMRLWKLIWNQRLSKFAGEEEEVGGRVDRDGVS